MKTKSAPILNRHHFARNCTASRKRQAARWDVNDVSRDNAGTHPSQCGSVQSVGVLEFRASKRSPRQSKAGAVASWKSRRQAAVLRALERLRCAASSRRPQANSGPTLHLPCRKMRCGPFQTNLAASHWFVSSRLISLLVVRTAIIVQPSFSMLSKQGPQRASTATLDQIASY